MMRTLRVATVVSVVLLWGCSGSDEAAPDQPAADATEDATQDDAADDGNLAGGDVSDRDGSDDDEGIEVTAEGNEAFGNVTLTLEPVVEVSWEPIDGADRYEVSVDGVDVGWISSSPYILRGGSGAVTVEALDDTGGEDLGLVPSEVIDSERLIVEWDQDAISHGVVGMAHDQGHNAGSAQQPHVIARPPEEIQFVLFGEMGEVEEQQADGTTTTRLSPPFKIDGDQVIENRPYIELPLPELP